MTAMLFVYSQQANATEIQIRPDQQPGSIQNQIRSLPPGSTIRFFTGRHTASLQLSDLHGTPQSPIRVTADPGATVEGTYDGSADKFSHGSGIIIDKSSDIIVEQLTISGFERGITLGGCRSVTVQSNNIHDVGNYGVMCYKSNDIKIFNNKIDKSYREHGIYISHSGVNIELSGNYIRDTHINGIHINGAIIKPIITNNHLERTGSFPTKEGGAGLTLVGGTSDPTVTGNTFRDIYGQSITLDAPNAIIKDNTFESYAWSGILALPKAQNLKMANNKFQDPKVIPLQFSSSTISSLQASGNHYYYSGPVCQEKESKRTYTIKEWRDLGKD